MRDEAYALSLDRPTALFEGDLCYVHPRAGIVPGAGAEGAPRVVMTQALSETPANRLLVGPGVVVTGSQPGRRLGRKASRLRDRGRRCCWLSIRGAGG